MNLSIIVPCYNAETTIRRCLDSLLAQTLSGIEIIAINDGSGDATLEILREYEAKHPSVSVYDQEDLGQGATVNRGVLLAKGKYIAECDSDDWVKQDMYEKLFNIAETDEADAVKCHYIEVTENGNEFKRLINPALCGIDFDIKSLSYKDKGILIGRPPALFAGIYRRDFIIRNKLFWREGKNYEDTSLSFKIAVSAKRFVFFDDYLYYHDGTNPNSGTNTIRDLYALPEQYEEMDRFSKEHHLALDPWLSTLRFYTYMWLLGICNESDKLRFIAVMREEFQKHKAFECLFNNRNDYEMYLLIGGIPDA